MCIYINNKACTRFSSFNGVPYKSNQRISQLTIGPNDFTEELGSNSIATKSPKVLTTSFKIVAHSHHLRPPPTFRNRDTIRVRTCCDWGGRKVLILRSKIQAQSSPRVLCEFWIKEKKRNRLTKKHPI